MSDKINKTPLCACVIYNKNNPNNKNINEKGLSKKSDSPFCFLLISVG